MQNPLCCQNGPPISNVTQHTSWSSLLGPKCSASLRGQDQKYNRSFSKAQLFLCSEGWSQKRELLQPQALQQRNKHSAAFTANGTTWDKQNFPRLGGPGKSTRPSPLHGEKVRCCQESRRSRKRGHLPFFLKRVDVPGTQ